MLSFKDDSYIKTREMLLAHQRLGAPLSDLASWIAQQYDVSAPVNIRLVQIDPIEVKARLRIIFRNQADADRFHRANKIDHDSKKAAAIIAKFRELAKGTQMQKQADMQLFATFSSFEKPARWQANASIPEDQLDRLEAALAPHSIWKIYPRFDAVTFFFNTDEQKAASLANGAREACLATYSKALAPYDRFDFFAERPIEAQFDSKETFERDFGGSWIAYNR